MLLNMVHEAVGTHNWPWGYWPVPMETGVACEPALARLLHSPCTLGTGWTWQWQPGPKQPLTMPWAYPSSYEALARCMAPTASRTQIFTSSSDSLILLTATSRPQGKELGEEIQANYSQDLEFEKAKQKNQEERNKVGNVPFFKRWSEPWSKCRRAYYMPGPALGTSKPRLILQQSCEVIIILIVPIWHEDATLSLCVASLCQMGIIKIITRCHYLIIREREKRKKRGGGNRRRKEGQKDGRKGGRKKGAELSAFFRDRRKNDCGRPKAKEISLKNRNNMSGYWHFTLIWNNGNTQEINLFHVL